MPRLGVVEDEQRLVGSRVEAAEQTAADAVLVLVERVVGEALGEGDEEVGRAQSSDAQPLSACSYGIRRDLVSDCVVVSLSRTP
jgi:hypothetical protein